MDIADPARSSQYRRAHLFAENDSQYSVLNCAVTVIGMTADDKKAARRRRWCYSLAWRLAGPVAQDQYGVVIKLGGLCRKYHKRHLVKQGRGQLARRDVGGKRTELDHCRSIDLGDHTTIRHVIGVIALLLQIDTVWLPNFW
ncbi:MAG: hypothetical protein ACRD63_08715 [Pyrinomonadaceae bacterium]